MGALGRPNFFSHVSFRMFLIAQSRHAMQAVDRYRWIEFEQTELSV